MEVCGAAVEAEKDVPTALAVTCATTATEHVTTTDTLTFATSVIATALVLATTTTVPDAPQLMMATATQRRV